MTLYTGLLIIVVLEIILAGFHRLPGLFTALRTLGGLAGTVHILVQAGRPPLYGPYEASVFLCLVTGCLALVFARGLGEKHGFFMISGLAALAVLALQWGKSMDLNPNYYMYEDPWVALFFCLRLIAVGFLVHGSAQYLAGAVFPDLRAMASAGGRNTLLTGACIYLAGEWAGSLWCLNWLGDSWQWSRGFFKASLLFLLVMAACHLPRFRQWEHRGWQHLAQGIAGALPGIFGIYMIFYY